MAPAERRSRKRIVRHGLRELGAQTEENGRRARLGAHLGTRGVLHGVDQHRQPQLPILAAPPHALPLLHRSIRLVAKAASGTPWPKKYPLECELPHRRSVPAPVKIRHGRKDLPAPRFHARSAYRLCLDRDGHRSRGAGPRLPLGDLTGVASWRHLPAHHLSMVRQEKVHLPEPRRDFPSNSPTNRRKTRQALIPLPARFTHGLCVNRA
jgi:hypothetical protein